MKEILNEKLSRVPFEPGVYLMKDADGRVIYVGKARNLKKRISSYFKKPGQLDLKAGILVKIIFTFETIITRTEKEALILESNLIKRHRPRYNVILKDDKRYPSLRLDMKSQYPNLNIVRKTAKDGNIYFGPFASAQAVRQTLKIIHKTFKLRKCKKKDFHNRSRPCLNYQIGACLAPCCINVDKDTYNEIVKEIILFLKGRTPYLINKIKKEMMWAAKAQEYEKAAILRDKIFALENTLEKQISVTTDFMDRDVLAVARSPKSSMVTLFNVRGGYLLGTQHFDFAETMSTDTEMIGAFIRQYYEKIHFIPKEILVPILPEDTSLLEDWLKNIKGQKVSLVFPKRGEKVHLLEMAIHNAENELKIKIASETADMDILARLQKKLKTDRIPITIECFDNSNISGTNPVAGMVVFEKGKPKKSLYRKYRIKTVATHDDYAYMAEALKRRYGKGEQSKPFPDLLLVDGGKGQLNIALSVIKELKVKEGFEIIGIAKKNEEKGETIDKVYKPGRKNPINFGREGDLLLFLQRIRDEAHRFAISYQRKLRTKTSMRSRLDAIPGIGKKRKKAIFKHFGSIKKIRSATLKELSALPGMNYKAAESVQKALNPEGFL